MKKIAMGLVGLDTLVGIALAIVLGLLSSVFLGSTDSTDKTIGAVVILAALAVLAHPALGIWLFRKERYGGASAYSGVFGLVGGVVVVIAGIFLQGTLSP